MRTEEVGEIYYSARELAKLLGISHNTPARWVNSGRVKAERSPGGDFAITRTSVIAHLNRTGKTIPAEILNPASLQSEVGFNRLITRNKRADDAYKKLLTTLDKAGAKPIRRRAVTMLDSNLWQGLSVLNFHERLGYLQAVADAVADYERLDKERSKCQ